MSRMSVFLLLTAVLSIVSAACSQMSQPVSVDRCPPRTTVVASSSPRLSASGKGLAPREEPSTSDNGTTGPASPRTPHLVAGGRGVAPWTACD